MCTRVAIVVAASRSGGDDDDGHHWLFSREFSTIDNIYYVFCNNQHKSNRVFIYIHIFINLLYQLWCWYIILNRPRVHNTQLLVLFILLLLLLFVKRCVVRVLRATAVPLTGAVLYWYKTRVNWLHTILLRPLRPYISSGENIDLVLW